ncbi:hypothetical protein HOLDEFILI_00639 [Holdemania filiformis DSM 12042]|uniref:Uncharacterized protein n=1 Tax=Holdemania filiformis DSM 12042 TaxID=545696 RepID=B9Y4A8_9FIRM|nr:hypothetical protein HOLDEFILI_00639 [Holdemania filiformis DSM 12042]
MPETAAFRNKLNLRICGGLEVSVPVSTVGQTGRLRIQFET